MLKGKVSIVRTNKGIVGSFVDALSPVGDEKRHFHETGLDKAINDLNNTIKAHMHIVDAIS